MKDVNTKAIGAPATKVVAVESPQLAELRENLRGWRAIEQRGIKNVAMAAAVMPALERVELTARDRYLVARHKLNAAARDDAVPVRDRDGNLVDLINPNGSVTTRVLRLRREAEAAEATWESARRALAEPGTELHKATKNLEHTRSVISLLEQQIAAEQAMTPEQIRARDVREAIEAARAVPQ